MLNISKNREFPERMYDLYDLTKSERGAYLNTWFPAVSMAKVNDKKSINHKKKYICHDEMGTLIKVDENTANRLYHRMYNPFIVFIMPSYSPWKNGANYDIDQFDIKAQICSIDDSSFGIWLNNRPLVELKELRLKVMEYISSKDEVNGEDFLRHCVSLGFDKETIDYN